jgi:mRNA-degrading endonuclease RelE of RelBE toxin-antitoxin system
MYTVYVLPRALQEIKRLPGHIRQRVKRVIDDLAIIHDHPAASSYRIYHAQSRM